MEASHHAWPQSTSLGKMSSTVNARVQGLSYHLELIVSCSHCNVAQKLRTGSGCFRISTFLARLIPSEPLPEM